MKEVTVDVVVPSPAHQGLQEHAGFTTGSFPPPDQRSRRCFLFLQEPFFSDELRRDALFFPLLPLRLLPPRLEHEVAHPLLPPYLRSGAVAVGIAGVTSLSPEPQVAVATSR